MAVPVVTSLSPSGGNLAGGYNCDIYCTELTTITTVRINGVSVAFSLITSGTDRLRFTVPAGTGSVYVTVTNADGTSATGPASTFTYSVMDPGEGANETLPTPSRGSWIRVDTLPDWPDPIPQPQRGSWVRIDTLPDWPSPGRWRIGRIGIGQSL
jgi:hypothetical protein